MTDEDREKENESITIPQSIKHNIIDISDEFYPSFDPKFLQSETPPETPLNYSQGMSAWCLDTMVSEGDRNAAR